MIARDQVNTISIQIAGEKLHIPRQVEETDEGGDELPEEMPEDDPSIDL